MLRTPPGEIPMIKKKSLESNVYSENDHQTKTAENYEIR